MIRKIFTYGFVEGVSKGLNRGVLFILPFWVSVESYGEIGILIAAEMLLPMVSSLGMDKAILRFYSEKSDYKSLSGTIFASISIFQVFIFLCYFFMLFVGIDSLFAIKVFPNLLILLLNVYLINIFQVLLNAHRVEEKHSIYYQSRLLFQILKFVSVIGLTVLFKDSIGYLIGVFISLVVTMAYNYRSYIQTFSLKYSSDTFRLLFLFCWPFIFHGIAGNMLGNLDRFILESFAPLSSVAMYTFAYSIGASVSFAFVGVSVYMEPQIYKSHKDKRREVLLKRYLLLTLIAGTLLFMLFFFLSEIIIPRFYPHYSNAISLIPIIGLSHLLMPFYFQGNYRLVYEKRALSVAKWSVFAALVNIGLNLFLIPHIGIYGAAYATFAAYFVLAVFVSLQSRKWRYSDEIGLLFGIASVLLVGLIAATSLLYWVTAVMIIVIVLVTAFGKNLFLR